MTNHKPIVSGMTVRRMKVERLQRRWTQTQLGARAAVSASDVSRIESGRFVPYPNQARRLARALGLTVDELLEPVAEAERAAS